MCLCLFNSTNMLFFFFCSLFHLFTTFSLSFSILTAMDLTPWCIGPGITLARTCSCVWLVCAMLIGQCKRRKHRNSILKRGSENRKIKARVILGLVVTLFMLTDDVEASVFKPACVHQREFSLSVQWRNLATLHLGKMCISSQREETAVWATIQVNVNWCLRWLSCYLSSS